MRSFHESIRLDFQNRNPYEDFFAQQFNLYPSRFIIDDVDFRKAKEALEKENYELLCEYKTHKTELEFDEDGIYQQTWIHPVYQEIVRFAKFENISGYFKGEEVINEPIVTVECIIISHCASKTRAEKALLPLIVEPSCSNNINFVIKDGNEFDLSRVTPKAVEVDIARNYGKDFVPVHQKILASLNEEDTSGLIVLHGDAGAGKTSYLRYLCGIITSKDIIYIPKNIVMEMSDPNFIPFLMEHTNSILIIEDAETIVKSRETSEDATQGVANLLNLADGFLGDCLKMKIICSFNTHIDNVDPALLRKGRLIAKHYFGKLDVEAANNLLVALKLDYKTTEPMTLADIYNIKDDALIKDKPKQRMGF